MVKSVAVVLGGGIDKDGKLWPDSRGRVDKALTRYLNQTDDKVIVSGACGYREGYIPVCSEADAMAEVLKNNGVSESDVLKESKSLNTFANAYYVKKILEKNNWKEISLITSDYHIARAVYIFGEYLGRDYSMKPCSYVSELPLLEYNKMVSDDKKKLDFAKKLMPCLLLGGSLTFGGFVKSHELFYYGKNKLLK